MNFRNFYKKLIQHASDETLILFDRIKIHRIVNLNFMIDSAKNSLSMICIQYSLNFSK